MDQSVVILGIAAGLFGLTVLFAFPHVQSNRFFHSNNERKRPCYFLFDGAELVFATTEASDFLDGSKSTGTPLEQLKNAIDNNQIAELIEELHNDGKSFSKLSYIKDGRVLEIVGRPIGGLAYISLNAASTNAKLLVSIQEELDAMRRKYLMLQETIDSAPVLVTRHSRQGQLLWQNEANKQFFCDSKPTASDFFLNDSGRACVESTDGKDQWVNLTRINAPDGSQTIYATPIDTLVNAEHSLANFVATLTETFAHLTTGLAIFDGEGRLSLFNPALSDLTGIDPTKLVMQPKMRDLLELMREARMTPEQKDFASWRQTLTRLEKGAREGTYREDWTLPSGRVFRVIGRPHPNGAVALIFEDISSTVSLERRYRDEIEIGQAALDRIGDAVAIFDTGGSLVFANNAFDDMWQINSMGSLDAPDIAQMSRRWAESCLTTPIWDRLRSFVTSEESRTSWQAQVASKRGHFLQGSFAPLPNGSTLTVFSHSRLIDANNKARDMIANAEFVTNIRDTLLALVSEDLTNFPSKELVSQGSESQNKQIKMLKSLVDCSHTINLVKEFPSKESILRFAQLRGVNIKFGECSWTEKSPVNSSVSSLIWTFVLAACEAGQTVSDNSPDVLLTAVRGESGIELKAEHPGFNAIRAGLSKRYLEKLAERFSGTCEIDHSSRCLFLKCQFSDRSHGNSARHELSFETG